MTTIVVTEMAVVEGHEVPVESLVFHPTENLVIYARLLVDPNDLPRLPRHFKMADIHLSAVLN